MNLATGLVGGGGGGPVTVSVVLLVAFAYVALMLVDPAASASTLNGAVFCPAETLTLLDKTFAVAGDVLDSETVAPPEGAALFSVTVPLTTVPTGTLLSLSDTLNSAAPAAGFTCQYATPPRPAQAPVSVFAAIHVRFLQRTVIPEGTIAVSDASTGVARLITFRTENVLYPDVVNVIVTVPGRVLSE